MRRAAPGRKCWPRKPPLALPRSSDPRARNGEIAPAACTNLRLFGPGWARRITGINPSDQINSLAQRFGPGVEMAGPGRSEDHRHVAAKRYRHLVRLVQNFGRFRAD